MHDERICSQHHDDEFFYVLMFRAEAAVDVAIASGRLKSSAIYSCNTLKRKLIGAMGYSSNLHIQLVQEFGVTTAVALGLVRRYGGRAGDVLLIAQARDLRSGGSGRGRAIGVLLAPGYNYIEAEVIYAVRHEWAMHASDVLSESMMMVYLQDDDNDEAHDNVHAL